jgi:hypothetical protein
VPGRRDQVGKQGVFGSFGIMNRKKARDGIVRLPSLATSMYLVIRYYSSFAVWQVKQPVLSGPPPPPPAI